MDDMRPVWRLQWGTPADLEKWNRNGVPYMSGDRLTSLVNEVRKAGFEAGEQQGRYNLRQAVEKGEIAPIGPLTEGAS